MHTLITPLTSNGLQDFEVFYDTILFNIKAEDSDSNEYINYVILQKITFDFDNINFTSSGRNYILNFGNTGSSEPFVTTTGNTHIDNILLEKTKQVLICGLSATMPVIYQYDINKNLMKRVFPSAEVSLLDWSNLSLGVYDENQRAHVSFNSFEKTLNVLIPTYGDSVYKLNFIKLNYGTDMNITEAISVSSNSPFPEVIQFKSFDDKKKVWMKDGINLVEFDYI